MIVVIDHDPAWATKFDVEAARVTRAAGAVVVRIHHIGSTAIPQTKAKPIIDMLLEVNSLDDLDERTPTLEALAHEADLGAR